VSSPHIKAIWSWSRQGLCTRSRAAPGSDADLLIMITPGVERFGYFGQLEKIAKGEARPESILEVQELCDNYFDQSPHWQR
jgi:hypothetical protein